MTPPEPLWDVRAVCARLNVPPSWVSEQAEKHGLPLIRVLRYRRFDPREVDARIPAQTGSVLS